MAFNPFSWFRHHQKAALVALTILTMIIFIGQFGQGDPIARLMGLFGAGRASGQVVTTLYGKKVRESDISLLLHQRRMASGFLYDITNIGTARVFTELNKSVSASAEGNNLSGLKKILADYQQTIGIMNNMAQFGNSPFLGQFLAGRVQQTDENLRLLEAYLLRPGLKDEEKTSINRTVVLLGQQRGVLSRILSFTPDGERIPRDSFYFGGSPKTEDLLDFRLWQLQADRLGVRLTEEDILKAITDESARADVFEADKPFGEQDQVNKFLAAMRRNDRVGGVFPPSELLDALREEFRVVIAQSILLGSEPGARAYRGILGASSTPALASPEEFLNYLREQRTTVRVKLFPVEATSFLDKVKDQPTEIEITNRYDRGAKIEPNPEMREPGFKLPRRIQVEYVVASSEDPFYLDQARKDARILALLSDPSKGRLANVLLTLTVPGLTKAVPLALDPLYSDIEPELRNNDIEWFNNPYNLSLPEEDKRKKLHLTSVFDPASLSSTFVGIPSGPLVALSNLFTTATGQELRQSLPLNLTMLLSQSDPRQLFGAAAMSACRLPPPVSRSLLEPQILASREKALAAESVQANLRKMREELAKLSRKPKEAREYITRAVKEYRLSIYTMPSLGSFFGILEDLKAKKNLNLEPLRKALDGDKPERLPNFVASLFGGQRAGEYSPEGPRSSPDAKQEVLYWRIQDKAAEDRKLNQVYDEVVASWRLDRARILARDHAEAIEAEANKLKTNPGDVERFLKEKGLTNSFELDNIAQLLPPAKEVLAGRTPDYRPYQIPQEQAEQFPYPPMDIAKQLTRLQKPGECTVILDRPASTYYVAVLLDRNEPTLEDFKSIYAKAQTDSLYQRFLATRRFEYRKSIVEQLRREAAGELDKEGRYKLPESVRREDTPSQDVE